MQGPGSPGWGLNARLMMSMLFEQNYCCEIRGSENPDQIWQNFLRKALAKKYCFANDGDEYIFFEGECFMMPVATLYSV
jgi:hypothetical protein